MTPNHPPDKDVELIREAIENLPCDTLAEEIVMVEALEALSRLTTRKSVEVEADIPTPTDQKDGEASGDDPLPELPNTNGCEVSMQTITKLGQWAYRNYGTIRRSLSRSQEGGISPEFDDDMHKRIAMALMEFWPDEAFAMIDGEMTKGIYNAIFPTQIKEEKHG